MLFLFSLFSILATPLIIIAIMQRAFEVPLINVGWFAGLYSLLIFLEIGRYIAFLISASAEVERG